MNTHEEPFASKKQRSQNLRGNNGVYKRGNLWLAVVEYPADPITKKRKRVWLTGFKTRAAALEASQKARVNIRNGIDVAPEKITLHELMQRWFEKSKTRIGVKTLDEYIALAERCIFPQLGGITIAKLRPMHIEQLYQDLLTKGRRNGKVQWTRFA